MKESFWGDLYGQTQRAWQRFFELQSERERDRFSGRDAMNGGAGGGIYRNGYYERDFVTRFGTTGASRAPVRRAFCRWG